MSIKGRPYTNFRGALKTGDLLLIRAAAAELPTVNLQDALDICIVVAAERARAVRARGASLARPLLP